MSTATSNIFLNDLISEVGNQTLQKLKINIFNLSTYNAYSASVQSTSNVCETYNQHKKNDKFYGTSFEELEAGYNNTNDALHGKSQHTVRTDRIGKANDSISDRVTYDKNGNVIATYQDKVILNSKDLLEDRYLKNDYITVPRDDYYKHKNYLENMAKNSNDEATRLKAQQVLGKLQKGNFTRAEAQNPRFTATKQQVKNAANHIGQTAISDGVNMALTTLASGFIVEVKLYYSGKSNETLWEHISRLIKKTLEQFKNGANRGAGFAGVDIIISTISGIFKGVFSNIKMIWDELRASLKSIYNGIYDYATGKIKTKAELFSLILKSLSSAIAVFGIAFFERKLSVYVGNTLATAISVIIGSFIVVSIPKIIDWFMNKFQATQLAKMRANEIANLCDAELPKIIEKRESLENEMNLYYNHHYARLNKAFSNLDTAIESNNTTLAVTSLKDITKEYGVSSDLPDFHEFSDLMLSDKPLQF